MGQAASTKSAIGHSRTRSSAAFTGFFLPIIYHQVCMQKVRVNT